MHRRLRRSAGCIAAVCVLGLVDAAHSGYLFTFSHASGLSAEAEFTLINPTTLEVRLRNTSTGVPVGFSNSDQILTGLSWDFGGAGINVGDVVITGGSAVIGPSSNSINFSTGNYGPGTDIGGEWGYGNNGGSGHIVNFISGNQSGTTPFGGANLDGPVALNGPQAGLISKAFSLPLGGLGAIKDELIATLSLNRAISEFELLRDLVNNGTRVEFGSDAAFLPGELVPAPGALALLGIAGLARRRRRTA